MMITLMKILPLLIGHLIPEDCEYWTLFKYLREILDIVISPVLSIDVSYYLECLTSDHHTLFLQLFSDKHLTPKHHFMTHYGEAIRRCGPLRHLWCMRYESKHQIAKKVGDLSNNFKNIALTVAMQYSLSNFSTWYLDEIWPITTVGSPLDDGRISSLCYRGVLFKPGSVIHYGHAHEKPLLSLIHSITCHSSQFIFNCTRLHVYDYCDHYCAFPVIDSELVSDVPLSDLICSQPLFIHYNACNEKFVYFPCKFPSSFNTTSLY